VVSVRVSSVGLVNGNWVRSVNVLSETNCSASWLSGPLFSGWVWVVCNIATGLDGSGSSNAGLVSISLSNSRSVCGSNIGTTLGLESLLCSNDISGDLLAWDEGNIGRTERAR
jgi:hypothetical protein